MLIIKKLYTEPEKIDPIVFSSGLNLICGEKDDTSEKTNGVGKSLCIEFINFALLKRRSYSRVLLIPAEIFASDIFICLDFEIDGIAYTIKRSIKESEEPIIIENDHKLKFSYLNDATKYLTEKLFASADSTYPEFRIMLGPLIRDETSEFKSIVGCYNTKLNIPDNYEPHLYLFGIDIAIYDQIRKYIKLLDEISVNIRKIKDSVKVLQKKEIDDSRADLNELSEQVRLIETGIDKLENISGYEVIKNEIISLEEEINTSRRQKSLLKQQVNKLKMIPHKVDIDVNEINEFYNQLKYGLGDFITADLKQVIGFKEKIDEFQNKLIDDRKSTLNAKIENIDQALEILDKKYTELLSVLDQKGHLKNLKQTYAAYKEKVDQLSQLKSFIERYDQLENEKLELKSKKEGNLLKLHSQIQGQKRVLEDFQNTILSVHEYVQGNRLASFQIKNTNKKQIIEIDMRIDSDGSHSVDREKVFIYDIALLLNRNIQPRHPGFLIHDNIFEVDQDTFIKNLKFLSEKANFGKTQYILTVNSDKFSDKFLLESLQPFIRASFTKENRFLKTKYQEVRKS